MTIQDHPTGSSLVTRHLSLTPGIRTLLNRGLCLAFLAWALSASGDEEFVGPFPSWRDARRDYGARGDGQADDTADDVWRNLAQPPARGGLLGCNVNTARREAAPKGYESLASLGEHPDPAKSPSGSGPLDNRGAVDDATLLRHLAPLRAARVWLPDASTPAGATDLRIHRVMASGDRGAVVEFRALP